MQGVIHHGLLDYLNLNLCLNYKSSTNIHKKASVWHSHYWLQGGERERCPNTTFFHNSFLNFLSSLLLSAIKILKCCKILRIERFVEVTLFTDTVFLPFLYSLWFTCVCGAVKYSWELFSVWMWEQQQQRSGGLLLKRQTGI